MLLGNNNTKMTINYVYGPLRIASQRGYIYFVSFVDDYLIKFWMYSSSTSHFTKFKLWKVEAEN